MDQEQAKSESVEALKRESGEPPRDGGRVAFGRLETEDGKTYFVDDATGIREDVGPLTPVTGEEAAAIFDKMDLPAVSDEPAPEILSLEPAAVEANAETELFALLRQYPPLMAQLYETLKSGQWLVTMHARVKDCTPDDLISHHTLKDFPVAEVVTVMQGHCRHILAEEARRLQRLDGRAADKTRWR